MSKNWAIVIGINQYNPNNLTPLKYAKQDAELMRDFFREAQFDQVCFFTDSPGELTLRSGKTMATQATYTNLISFLHDRFEKPFLSAGDNCWFFFAGHGECYKGQDFLMPQDGNPRAETWTAIPLSLIRERLCRSGAGNVILILDACRSEGSRSSVGISNEAEQGVIKISACSPTQKSWEIDELQHGVFTFALHEGLSMSAKLNCTTVAKLNQFLISRVAQLCNYYKKFPEQNPHVVSEPLEKSYLVLLPDYIISTGGLVPQTDIETLKNAVHQAFFDSQIDLAELLCLQAISATMGRDMKLLEMYGRLQQKRASFPPTQHLSSERTVGSRNAVQTAPSKQPTQPPPSEDDLSSEKGVDYNKLRNLLRKGEWKQADWETSNVIRQMAGRTTDRWLRVGDIALLPKQDLRTIDRLWTKYSNGRFGFSAQKQIWKACGNPEKYGEARDKFTGTVGWYKGGQPDRHGYSMKANDAPPGHFPRDFAFTTSHGGTARGREAAPFSLTAKLLGRAF